MSHIHIPDGVLPWWLVILGWIVTATLVALAVRASDDAVVRRRVPLVGAMGALMLVAMSSEIVPIAYHVNLTVLAGILLGPWMSAITALVVTSMLALVGHGGVTMIGLNTVMIATEMIVGYGLFRLLTRVLGHTKSGWASAISTVLVLALSTSMLVGIVAVGGSAATGRESGALDPNTLTFSNPLKGGLFSNVLVSGEEHGGESSTDSALSVGKFATVVYSLGSIGWLLEALITAGIVRFISRVRPNLVFERAEAHDARHIVGDEGARH